MREILFRGKRLDNNEWVYGGYCFIDGKCFIVYMEQYVPDIRDWDLSSWYDENTSYSSYAIEVISETVGQYTGLTDENSVKIFEGDIVKTELSEDNNPCIFYSVVGFEDGSFILAESERDDDKYIIYEYCKVIGNKYDNPELFKKFRNTLSEKNKEED